MNIVKTFFSKIRALFLILKKGRGDLLPLVTHISGQWQGVVVYDLLKEDKNSSAKSGSILK